MPPSHPPVPALAGRRADAGTVRLTGRDITGLMLCAEQYGAPYDLLAAALNVRADRLRGVVARWRQAGCADTGTLGPGPAWCWLTPTGMKLTGRPYPAARPAIGRLAHIRAVLAARLWLEAGEAYQDGKAWWRSERRIRAALGGHVGTAHLPDAEVHWPSLDGSPYGGQVWAIEAELTPKPLTRTVRDHAGAAGPHQRLRARRTRRAGSPVRPSRLPDRSARPAHRAPGHQRAARTDAAADRGPRPAPGATS